MNTMPPIFALLLEMEHKRKLYIGEGDLLALSHLITAIACVHTNRARTAAMNNLSGLTHLFIPG